MHDGPVAPYPRRVVVPAILSQVGCPVTVADDGAAARGAAAAATVDWVRAAMGRLPEPLLDLTLPDPRSMFRSWSLGARTRGAVAQLGGAAPVRVREILGAARLGPAALVDLLAAREENQADDNDGVAFPHLLTELAALIADRLPLRPEQLSELAALPEDAREASAVVRLFQSWNAPVPFRHVRRGGADILVAPTSFASADALVSAALQTIQRAGLCRVSAVVERVRSFAATELDARAAARVLATLPCFRWLDEPTGWFSLVGTTSLVASAIGKMLFVADAVSLGDLSRGLAKFGKGLVPPLPILKRYLGDVLGCDVEDGCVRRGPSFEPTPLGSTERIIVESLRQNGGARARLELRRQLFAEGVAPTTLRELLRTSPLFLATKRDVRLVGRSSVEAARLAA
ncbi:MAG TPA: hypothetical protein VH560_16545 [Polyangia bacterium]|jgi:hypothetical protein|nr:hypothetical protein [Polyangia bacterium]